MSSRELKTTFYLASIYAFRMLGLFMILPIFSLYADHFKYANATLIGFALGVYGLTQGLLQIPFGMYSDKVGRKPVIIFGLILFMAGSVIAALSHTIYGIILGRALQGAGAIGSTLTALVADNTQEENRLKAMSIIGMTIGFSFMLAMVLGPILDSFIGLSGIFWLTAVLACLGIIILLLLVPTPKKQFLHRDNETVANQFTKLLTSHELLRLDFSIFSLHAILTASFIIIPIIILKNIGIDGDHQWYIYLPILTLSFVAMMPFIIIAEAKRMMKPLFISAITLMTITQLAFLFFQYNLIYLCLLLFLFFTAFNFLEASLPSLIAKIAPAGNKGTAMGIYSSSQFLGILVGGTIGGITFHQYGYNGVFIFCSLLGLIWLLLALTMRKPEHLSSKIIPISKLYSEEAITNLQTRLFAIKGIKDVMICPDEQAAYLKVDKKEFDEKDLKELLINTNKK